MRSKNKKYGNFRYLCKLVQIPEQQLAVAISSTQTGKQIQTETQTASKIQNYLITVIAKKAKVDEYLVSIQNAKDVIFQGWIRLHKLKRSGRKKNPAISHILDIVILLAIAGAASGAFYYFATDSFETNSARSIEIVRFDITKVGDDSDNGLAHVIIYVPDDANVRLGGDIAEIRLTDVAGNALGLAEIHARADGFNVHYEGLVKFTGTDAIRGEFILVSIQYGNHQEDHTVLIK